MSAAPPPTPVSPKALGRVIALLFLATIVLGIVAQMGISDRMISFRDPARTVAAIRANGALYGAGFTIYLLEMAAQVAFTVLTYFLLRPASRRVATLALVFGLVGCTVKIVARVFYIAPFAFLNGPALPPGDAESITLAMLTLNDRGAAVALAFFGFQGALEAWLVYRSTFFPRWLGVLQFVAGIGWLAWLSPTLGYATFNLVAPLALLGSIVWIGWLLVKGVDEDRWRALA